MLLRLWLAVGKSFPRCGKSFAFLVLQTCRKLVLHYDIITTQTPSVSRVSVENVCIIFAHIFTRSNKSIRDQCWSQVQMYQREYIGITSKIKEKIKLETYPETEGISLSWAAKFKGEAHRPQWALDDILLNLEQIWGVAQRAPCTFSCIWNICPTFYPHVANMS